MNHLLQGWPSLRKGGIRLLLALALLPAGAEPPRKVTLHLKWSHQFQFAGFYAAQAKGFYQAEGLEVTLKEAGPTQLPLAAVEKGETEFGVSDIEVFQAYLEGRPLVALGVIFQHSPNVILSTRQKGILRPADLAGRGVMFQGGQGLAEALAMLKSEGLKLDSFQKIHHSWNLDDLIAGRVDAIQAYSTNEPYLLKMRGADVVQLRPIEYGVDFYGDTLFTTTAFAAANPELTAAFTRASFKGWEYAMEHPEEMIDRILAMPGLTARGLDRAKLRFEAEQMKDLVVPRLVDAGHMNPGRFRRIAETLAATGQVKAVKDPEGFVYAPPVPPSRAWLRALKVGLPVAAAIALLTVLWITQLRHTVFARTKALLKEVQQRKRTEQALRESEARFRVLFEGAPDAIILADPESGRILDANQTACRLLGRERDALVGIHQKDLHPPEDEVHSRASFQRHAAEAKSGNYNHPIENQVLRLDGTKVPVEVLAQLIQVQDQSLLMGTFRDITERRRLEEERRALQAQLTHAQKMESLGSLASGVAHDMNNVLGAILGMASVHQAQAEPGSPLQRGLETITKAAQRGGQLVKGLLNFARHSPSEERELDLNAILREEVQLLERTTFARVRLELDLAQDLRPIRGEGGALIHAFMNLCVNAVDAMADSGRLILRTRNLDDDCIEVQVEDTGSGMTADVLEKAFDPFFTTKGQGKGTGLGLAIVYGTVKAHRGQIEVHSEPGRGTRVHVRFPASHSIVPEPRPEPESDRNPGAPLRVLLIDDDDLIRDSVTAILEALGHTAVVAESGEVALAAMEAGERPDLVILDLNMPGLGGAGTLPRLRALRPDLPVLLATGRADQTAIDLAAAHPKVTLLAKPFSVATLQLQIELMGRV